MESNHRPQHYQFYANRPCEQGRYTNVLLRGTFNVTLAHPWSPIFTPYCGANVVLPRVEMSPTVVG